MVLAYALIGEADPHEDAKRALRDAEEVWAPDSLRSELANVVWQWVTANRLPLAAGREVLRNANALVTHFVPTDALWEEALALSVDQRHPVYDTLFVTLAMATGRRVVTDDRKLLELFPDWTKPLRPE